MAQTRKAVEVGASDSLIEKLVAFEPSELPFISLYLNTQPNERGRDEFASFLRKELPRRARTYAVHTPERESFDRDVERINDYLRDELKESSNGVAIFACAGQNDFFEAAQFEAPIGHHRLYIFDQPHLYPLARLADEFRRYAVVVADTNRARIFVVGFGRTLKSSVLENTKTRRSHVGGWSQMRFQRHIENYHLHHAKEVADVLERIVRTDGIQHVIVAGDQEVIVPLLTKQFPKAVAEKVVDVLSLPIDAPEHEILEHSAKAMRAYDAQTDVDKVNRLLDEYRANGLGVVGEEDTLEALAMGQVEELIISARQQDIKGDRDDVAILADRDVAEPTIVGSDGAVQNIEADSIVADDLVKRAEQTADRITFIEDPSLLSSVGGVGALLRFRIEPPPSDEATIDSEASVNE